MKILEQMKNEGGVKGGEGVMGEGGIKEGGIKEGGIKEEKLPDLVILKKRKVEEVEEAEEKGEEEKKAEKKAEKKKIVQRVIKKRVVKRLVKRVIKKVGVKGKGGEERKGEVAREGVKGLEEKGILMGGEGKRRIEEQRGMGRNERNEEAKKKLLSLERDLGSMVGGIKGRGLGGTGKKKSVVRDKKGEGKKRGLNYKEMDQNEGSLKNIEKKVMRKSEESRSSVPKLIEIMETIKVSDLAKKLNIKSKNIISNLMNLGVMATINEVIDGETASLIASEYGAETKIISLYDETLIKEETSKGLKEEDRAPIITVMGHVDHGKTSLLDAIRNTNVMIGEDGGITQHIGAYRVEMGGEKKSITFLDTPGHEAFTLMRARGTKLTDIVILVVAADDGVKPQTVEAINHAKDANVPIVVAINKIDLESRNIEKVKKELSEYGLISEDWGGQTLMIEVSSLKKKNLDKLLEGILLEGELLDLKVDWEGYGVGTVLESKIDLGRGAVATVLIKRGQVKVGDYFVSGIYSGKVRALMNDRGGMIKAGYPSWPVEVIGLSGVPRAGDPFNVVKNEKVARQIAQKRQELEKIKRAKDVKKVTLEDLSEKLKKGEEEDKELKIVLKGDVEGSIEALKDSFEKLRYEGVKVKVIHYATGGINENDVMLASASQGMIIGFHVHPNSKALMLSQRENVEIRKYEVIYDAIDDLRDSLEGMMRKGVIEERIGECEVREVFSVSKVGKVAGCYVKRGKMVQNMKVRLIRDGVGVYEGKIESLKRFKDDAHEVKEGYECGLSLSRYNDLKVGDEIEGYEVKEVERKKKEVKKESLKR